MAEEDFDAPLDDKLDHLRERGWRLAVHNDYRLNGAWHTLYLFTDSEDGTFVKGEGATDHDALNAIFRSLGWTYVTRRSKWATS